MLSIIFYTWFLFECVMLSIIFHTSYILYYFIITYFGAQSSGGSGVISGPCYYLFALDGLVENSAPT